MAEAAHVFVDEPSWAIVELMGHVRMAGVLTEKERFGTKIGRVDIPGPGDKWTTVYFGGSSVYRITPTTEEVARGVARRSQPQPVHRWELPEPAKAVDIMDGSPHDDDEDCNCPY